MGGYDAATWQALGLTLTLLGLVLSVLMWRRRGAATGTRWVAWSLVPLAAALTGVLRLGWEVADAVVDWSLRLAFSPVVWLGVALAGVSACFFVLSGLLARRSGRSSGSGRPAGGSRGSPDPKASRASKASRGSEVAGSDRGTGRQVGGSTKPAAGDGLGLGDDLADVEEILRRRGIQ